MTGGQSEYQNHELRTDPLRQACREWEWQIQWAWTRVTTLLIPTETEFVKFTIIPRSQTILFFLK